MNLNSQRLNCAYTRAIWIFVRIHTLRFNSLDRTSKPESWKLTMLQQAPTIACLLLLLALLAAASVLRCKSRGKRVWREIKHAKSLPSLPHTSVSQSMRGDREGDKMFNSLRLSAINNWEKECYLSPRRNGTNNEEREGKGKRMKKRKIGRTSCVCGTQ